VEGQRPYRGRTGLPVILDDGAKYLYGAGLVAQKSGSSKYYYLADGLGSTMAMVDTTGAVQKSYTYDIYGKPTATGSVANEFDFRRPANRPHGPQYLRARHYDTATGTFLSREPMAKSPVWRGALYSYAAGNPGLLTDPTGLFPGQGAQPASARTRAITQGELAALIGGGAEPRRRPAGEGDSASQTASVARCDGS